MAAFDDGSGPALYTGGHFTTVAGQPWRAIARWDGWVWSGLGAGLGDAGAGRCRRPPVVTALQVFDDGMAPVLVVGGQFRTAAGIECGNVAGWSSLGWQRVGDDLYTPPGSWECGQSGDAFAIRPNPHRLVVGGWFVHAGNHEANGLAELVGDHWEPVGSGVVMDLTVGVRAIAFFDDGNGPALYVGGIFSVPGVPNPCCFAKWDGSTWSFPGGGLHGVVWSMKIVAEAGGDALYVGGLFDTAGGAPASNIARWDGTTWSALGDGIGTAVELSRFGGVTALETFNDGTGTALYAGGAFHRAGGAPAANIARWDGRMWSPLGSGTDGAVRALAVWDRDGEGPEASGLYVGGEFNIAGGMNSPRIAKWQGCDTCYPDCDTTTGPRNLDIFDFLCFQNRYEAGTAYACNCDTSTGPGVCDIFDFLCFQNAFASGCP